MNMQARQVKLAQQQVRVGQALRRAPAQAQQPVNVAGCGGFGQNIMSEGWGDPSLPNAAPRVPPELLVNPYQILQNFYSPLGFRAQAAAGGALTTVSVFPTQGLFFGAGIRTFNQPDEILIQRISAAGADIALNAGPFDAAAYNTIECFCPIDVGCFQRNDPLTISFSSIGTPSVAPFLNGVIFGTQQQSYKACYPGLGSALGCGAYGMGYGQAG